MTGLSGQSPARSQTELLDGGGVGACAESRLVRASAAVTAVAASFWLRSCAALGCFLPTDV